MSSTAAFPVISTERLVLREIVDDDASNIFAIHSDRASMRWWGDDPPTDIAQTKKLIAAWAGWRATPNPGVRWGLEAVNGGLIGTCGLFKWNDKWRSCSTSYELGSEWTGMGFMIEAMNAIIDWGWEHMSLNRVEALVHPDNAPSQELLARLGFEREGHLRQAARWDGQYHDLLLMARLRD